MCRFGGPGCGDAASGPQQVIASQCNPRPLPAASSSGSPYITNGPNGISIDVTGALDETILRVTGAAAQKLMLRQKEEERPLLVVSQGQRGEQARDSNSQEAVYPTFEGADELAGDVAAVVNERVGSLIDYVNTLPLAFKIGATLGNPNMPAMSKLAVCAALIGDVAVPGVFAGAGAVVGAGAGGLGAVGGGVAGGVAGRYVAGQYEKDILSQQNQDYYNQMNDVNQIINKHRGNDNNGSYNH
jgi:hypothetical protein